MRMAAAIFFALLLSCSAFSELLNEPREVPICGDVSALRDEQRSLEREEARLTRSIEFPFNDRGMLIDPRNLDTILASSLSLMAAGYLSVSVANTKTYGSRCKELIEVFALSLVYGGALGVGVWSSEQLYHYGSLDGFATYHNKALAHLIEVRQRLQVIRQCLRERNAQ